MKLYVAGPMSGYDNLNFDAFDRAEHFLAHAGYGVVNPANLDRDMGIDPTRYSSLTLVPETLRQQALRRDFADLVTCDAIVMLSGWERSKGACAERRIAEDIGLAVYRLSFDPVHGLPTFEQEQVATLIGLSGYAQSGKDTLGAIAVNHYRFTRLAFADALKRVALDSDPYTNHLVQAHGWEGAKRVPEVRTLLQHLGIAVREHVDPDAWVNAALRHVSPGGRYVITDVRFPNEAQAIKDRGGVMVRVHRPGVAAVNAHVSETALDGWDFDHHVYNDGSLDKLGVRAALLLEAVL